MRRITMLIGTVGVLVAGGVGAVIGCGGSDDATTPKPTVSSSSSSGSNTSSSSGDLSSSSSSGFTTSSSSSSSSSSGTAGVTNPNQITCGTALCDAGTTPGSGNPSFFCCARDGGTDSVCIRDNQSSQCDNSSDQNTLQLNCDESADCPVDGTQHEQCCLSRTGDVATNCQGSCGGGTSLNPRAQVCKTDAECSDGGAAQPTCAEKTCRGFKIHVCGTPEGCQ
jgi:hypothetical protein